MGGRVGGSEARSARTSERALRRASVRASVAQRVAARRRKRRIIISISVVLAVLAVAGGVTFAVYYARTHKTGFAATADQLKDKPTVTPGTGDLTALKVQTLVKGKGKPVKAGQTITVNYVGTYYATGKEFDSSWSRSQPFETVIGEGQLIPGWDKGLIGVTVGSRIILDIPSDMAYGDQAAANGAPAGPLRFVVDVLGAK